MLCVCAQVESEQCAREVCEYRAALQRRRAQRVHREEGEGVPLVVKGDVVGSVEALGGVLISRQPEQLRLNVVHSGVGAILPFTTVPHAPPPIWSCISTSVRGTVHAVTSVEVSCGWTP